jgi:hypothetical protein
MRLDCFLYFQTLNYSARGILLCELCSETFVLLHMLCLLGYTSCDSGYIVALMIMYRLGGMSG